MINIFMCMHFQTLHRLLPQTIIFTTKTVLNCTQNVMTFMLHFMDTFKKFRIDALSVTFISLFLFSKVMLSGLTIKLLLKSLPLKAPVYNL